jgi:hypothetical protein
MRSTIWCCWWGLYAWFVALRDRLELLPDLEP